ncbi:MAG: acyl-CoA dehydrogenase family protein [Anaerolineae bacterium]
MINFELGDEQKALRDLTRRFAQEEILPVAAECDQKGEFPLDVAQKAFDIGLMNVTVPEEYGGGGLGHLDECIVREEMAAGCAGISATLGISGLAVTPVILAGTEEQKQRFLAPLCAELSFASYCVTEPSAGSDVAGITSTAELVGDEYVLNGTKRFITGGGLASWFVVLTYTDKSLRRNGISAFVVPADAPGVTVAKKEDMMGQRASNTAEIVFENVRVPKANRLGREGQGFKLAMETFDITRPYAAAGAIGLARSAMEHASRYAQERFAFGRPIGQFQAIQFMLANMAIDIAAARWLTWHAAWLSDRDLPNAMEASYAKALAADMCMRVTTDAVQVFGGYGYSREYPVEKLMRDAKVMQIYEGTSEIQRLIIGRQLLKK